VLKDDVEHHAEEEEEGKNVSEDAKLINRNELEDLDQELEAAKKSYEKRAKFSPKIDVACVCHVLAAHPGRCRLSDPVLTSSTKDGQTVILDQASGVIDSDSAAAKSGKNKVRADYAYVME
jgi:hypothetical protein